MNKKMRRCLAVLLVFLLCLSSAQICMAKSGLKLQIYFSPHIMDTETGEVAVDVNIRNINGAIPDDFGDLCALSFMFDYNSRVFSVDQNEDGTLNVIVDNDMLVKDLQNIETAINDNRIRIAFTDESLEHNLISRDGTLCRFVLCAKNARELWNSFDVYPLAFVPGSVGASAYRVSDATVTRVYNIEAIDVNVGGYNKAPTLKAPTVDKHITFTEGKPDINVGGEIIKTDARAFFKGENFMIPLRYFADAVGMKVTWDAAQSIAGAYCDYKTVKVSFKNNSIYINSVKCNSKALPVETGGRTYISSDVVKQIFPGAVVNVDKDAGTAEIYIP